MSLTEDMIDIAMHVAETESKDFESQIFPGGEVVKPHWASDDDDLEVMIQQFQKRKTKKLTREIGFRTKGHIYSKAVRVLEMLR
jgi:hypothetical protein